MDQQQNHQPKDQKPPPLKHTTNSSGDHLHLGFCNPTKEEAHPRAKKLWVWKFLGVPTLGERSHKEVVEIASHLGKLPLAPFPALAHLGAVVVVEVEVMEVMVVLAVG